MSYRDDLAAAHERLRVVEKELAASRADDAADDARIAELEEKLAEATRTIERLRPLDAQEPWHRRTWQLLRRHRKLLGRALIVTLIVGPIGACVLWLRAQPNCSKLANARTSDLKTADTLCTECNDTEMRCIEAGNLHRHAGDTDRARARYRKACAYGWAPGCAELAELDEPNAARHLLKACALRDWRTCNLLGVRLAAGRGVQADIPAARAAYQLACDHGIQMGCRNLAVSLEGFEPKDPAAARAPRERACALGEAESCAVVARQLAADGDVERGADKYREACDLGIGWACANLADLTPDAMLAGELRRRACGFGHTPACP